MTRSFTVIFLTCLLSVGLNASPAFPDPVRFLQTDGSIVTIIIRGDEFLNWKETTDGYTLLHNSAGGLEYANTDSRNNLVVSGILAHDPLNRQQNEIELLYRIPRKLFYSQEQISILNQYREIQTREMSRIQQSRDALNAASAFPTTGDRKLICLLAAFADKPFTLTKQDFENLFNQLGYVTDGATGSVRDYHREVSYNQFDLTVDLVAPYTVSQNMAYYGNNTNGNAKAMVTEVVNAADAVVDFSNYDNDNNGTVDGVYVIFAGYGEEAGAPADAIWSHASSITPLVLDGKTISRYSCSPELRSNAGSGISRIGVICHEFGHVLGAPDYYDTDYETGGSFTGTGKWDIMAGGTWNNSGATPAHHNGWTKVMFYNWAAYQILTSSQDVTLNNAAQFNDSFFRFNTSADGEYFFVENREKHLFDAFIPGSGMIIYRVHSGVLSVGNRINATHPQRMYPVSQNAVADPTGAGTYGTINTAGCAWDGSGKTVFNDYSVPSSKSWAGEHSYKPVTNISRDNTSKTVSFSFMGGELTDPAITTWNGTHWDDLIPDVTRDVVIAADFHGSGFNCNNLTVNPGKHLSISEGSLDVAGDFTLQSDETGTATFIDSVSFTVGGNSVMEQYLNSARNWYLSSPLNEPVAPAGFGYYRYKESGNPVYWQSFTAGSVLTNLSGFIAQASGNAKITFTGSGDVTFNTGLLSNNLLTRTALTAKPGFNLVGNPYPSFLNAAVSINANPDLEKSLWYRTKNLSGNYVFDVVNTTTGIGTNNNGSGVVSAVIPPVQSFWVKLKPSVSSATLTFNNSHRFHESSSMLLKSRGNLKRTLVRIKLSDGINSDETVICFDDQATELNDIFDSEKIFDENPEMPAIYIQKLQDKLAICGENTASLKSAELSLGILMPFRKSAEIQLVEMSGFDSDCDVLLVDKLNQREYILNEGFIFNFEPDLGKTDNRFGIKFKSSSLLSVTGNPAQREDLKVYTDEYRRLRLFGNVSDDMHIFVYNTAGQLLESVLPDNQGNVFGPELLPGVYWVKISSASAEITGKLIVK